MGEASPFPEQVGRYELLLPIASGGMATVYLARMKGAAGFERDVALKLTHAHLRQDPTFTREVLDEAHLAARIHHPNVVSVLDVGDDPLGVFLVMDYIEGDTLAGLVRLATPVRDASAAGRRPTGGALPLRISARILLDALAGLHAAHELRDADGMPLGLVHRDFSPQNLLIGVDGVTRLADFGVAKAASRLEQTKTGIVKGKVSYMAPEQARGLPLDRRCDIWAAGVVAWELAAGRRLYAQEHDGLATLFKIVSEVPPRLAEVMPGIGPELDETIARALDSRVDVRPPTAADFRAALTDAFRAGPGIADTDEVASYVAPLFGAQLGARRERIHQVLTLRGRLRRVTSFPLTPDAVTGQSPAREAERGETHDGAAPEPSSHASPPAWEEAAPSAGSPAAPRTVVLTRPWPTAPTHPVASSATTATRPTSASAPRTATPRTPKRVLLFAASLAAVGAVFALTRRTTPSDAMAVSSVASAVASPSTPSASAAPPPPEAATATATAAAPAPVLPAAPMTSAEPMHPTTRPRARPARVAPGHRATSLLPNPYEAH